VKEGRGRKKREERREEWGRRNQDVIYIKSKWLMQRSMLVM